VKHYAYPSPIKTAAQRAHINNLGKDERLALAVNGAIIHSLQNDLKTNSLKTQKLRISPLKQATKSFNNELLSC